MDRELFNEEMSRLMYAFPQSKIEPDEMMLQVWFDSVKTLTNSEFYLAVREAIDTERFFPSIAAILAHVPREAELVRGCIGHDPEAHQTTLNEKVIELRKIHTDVVAMLKSQVESLGYSGGNSR